MGGFRKYQRVSKGTGGTGGVGGDNAGYQQINSKRVFDKYGASGVSVTGLSSCFPGPVLCPCLQLLLTSSRACTALLLPRPPVLQLPTRCPQTFSGHLTPPPTYTPIFLFSPAYIYKPDPVPEPACLICHFDLYVSLF